MATSSTAGTLSYNKSCNCVLRQHRGTTTSTTAAVAESVTLLIKVGLLAHQSCLFLRHFCTLSPSAAVPAPPVAAAVPPRGPKPGGKRDRFLASSSNSVATIPSTRGPRTTTTPTTFQGSQENQKIIRGRGVFGSDRRGLLEGTCALCGGCA